LSINYPFLTHFDRFVTVPSRFRGFKGRVCRTQSEAATSSLESTFPSQHNRNFLSNLHAIARSTLEPGNPGSFGPNPTLEVSHFFLLSQAAPLDASRYLFLFIKLPSFGTVQSLHVIDFLLSLTALTESLRSQL
jgi:hypothetical protein